MGLTPEQLREVLARAEEIQSASRHGREMRVELESVISATEEVGLADGKLSPGPFPWRRSG